MVGPGSISTSLAIFAPASLFRTRLKTSSTFLTTLSSKQRATLRAMAHSLKPIVFIGKEGVTDATVQSLTDAFNRREVLKVKVQQMAPEESREVGNALVERIENLHVVQVIGRTIILYRPFPDAP
jgi:RNA-binding protein